VGLKVEEEEAGLKEEEEEVGDGADKLLAVAGFISSSDNH
jgi:hypothetical protein